MIKIYAVRDRLIDYYMQPFIGPSDKEVMSALARTINNTEDTNGIAQAPHHFELWELGTIGEEGEITPTRKLVCDCASLIRRGVRSRTQREGQEAPDAAGADTPIPGGTRYAGRAPNGAIPRQAPPEETATGEVRREPQGGYPPRNGS